ncbi:MAG: hydroxylamine reductase [Phycisphaerales bacterium]|nr:MAG: hydroxylamine reductase [Phycisphaerales bacterium]
MFCNQCEQTAQGTACVKTGVCGKDPDMQSLQETLLYGLKGMAAYAHHARRLGMVDEEVDAFVEEALFATVTNVNFDTDSLLELVLECGRKNLRVMEMLDEGHVKRFGSPSPTTVYEGTKAGPGILVTGHDLLDLEDLLKQTKGTGINVYTHGEMLPAHMYPELRKYEHLAGHFGGAWQKQKSEWSEFTGPILATTNCVLIPKEAYKDRLFTTRVTAVPGGKRLMNNDFAAVIECAKRCAPLADKPVKESTIGFHHSVVLGLADKIVGAVKAGKLSHFFLIGGCDGAEPGRNYFSEFARNTPADSVVLTLGCGKFRIRDNDFGMIELEGVGPVPRLLDMGQCNDAYGAIQVAVALSKAFDCGVNDLPLTIVLSWFEQKAVAVLLTLLALGVKGIRVGPVPPAFISPNVFKVLQEKYDLKLTSNSDPAADLSESFASSAAAQ